MVDLARSHTTVSVERATLRLAGLGGADHENVPWVNHLVDAVRDGVGLEHGVALPVWDALGRDVAPDLTTLARRSGGRFPETQVLDVLRNGVVIPAHGLADMPAWGTDSRLMDISNPSQISQRIGELVTYLKSKQVK